MLPIEVEPVETMRARYPEAIADEYDAEAVLHGDRERPGVRRRHVFDFPDGFRLIISRERYPNGDSGVHVSASAFGNTERLIASGRLGPDLFCDMLIEHYQDLSGDSRKPTFLGFTPDKKVPHFLVRND